MTETIKEFVDQHLITMATEYAGSNPNMQHDDKWQANHYKVTLRMDGRRLTTYFSMGLAHVKKPTADDVLSCLAMDAAGTENARSFEEWAGEYGYDTDSRKAERMFRTCQQQSRKLKKFIGDPGLYQKLLFEIEHL
jgi:hypothetical protein